MSGIHHNESIQRHLLSNFLTPAASPYRWALTSMFTLVLACLTTAVHLYKGFSEPVSRFHMTRSVCQIKCTLCLLSREPLQHQLYSFWRALALSVSPSLVCRAFPRTWKGKRNICGSTVLSWIPVTLLMPYARHLSFITCNPGFFSDRRDELAPRLC